MHQHEGATRLQEVEADSLVAVAKLDADSPLACRRWQARMCPSWVSTHWHILRRNPIIRETRRAQPAPRYCAWAKTETDVPLPGGRWYITQKTQEKEEKDQVYGIQPVQYSLVYIHSTSTVYMSTVSREQCYNARGVSFYIDDDRSFESGTPVPTPTGAAFQTKEDTQSCACTRLAYGGGEIDW